MMTTQVDPWPLERRIEGIKSGDFAFSEIECAFALVEGDEAKFLTVRQAVEVGLQARIKKLQDLIDQATSPDAKLCFELPQSEFQNALRDMRSGKCAHIRLHSNGVSIPVSATENTERIRWSWVGLNIEEARQ